MIAHILVVSMSKKICNTLKSRTCLNYHLFYAFKVCHFSLAKYFLWLSGYQYS
jgi:hypothetical protein